MPNRGWAPDPYIQGIYNFDLKLTHESRRKGYDSSTNHVVVSDIIIIELVYNFLLRKRNDDFSKLSHVYTLQQGATMFVRVEIIDSEK